MLRNMFRKFSMNIPKEKLIITNTKKIVPQGSKINKLLYSTEVRFKIDASDWIPNEVKENLKQMYPFFINKQGEFYVLSSSIHYLEYPDLKSNEADALEKMQKMLEKASEPPKTKKLEKEKEKEINFEKARKSQIKTTRREKIDERM